MNTNTAKNIGRAALARLFHAGLLGRNVTLSSSVLAVLATVGVATLANGMVSNRAAQDSTADAALPASVDTAPANAVTALKAVTAPVAFAPDLAYGGANFGAFVSDSYRATGQPGGPSAFYAFFNQAYRTEQQTVGVPAGLTPGNVSASQASLGAALSREGAYLKSLPDSVARTDAQMKFAAWTHRFVKTAIPHFSLQNGFELANMTAPHGERQCYGQATLIAGFLQRAGIPAGVAMVWKNPQGQASNNGHAVAVARLVDGNQIIVDASDPQPFARQQGLFLRVDGAYNYVAPVYNEQSEITGYTMQKNNATVSPAQTELLDEAFMRSQFDYYRGERAPGGILDKAKTPQGMENSARFLQKAQTECPQNPLAVYMLGRVYDRLGQSDKARRQFAQAWSRYENFGHVPQGAQDAYRNATVAFNAPKSL